VRDATGRRRTRSRAADDPHGLLGCDVEAQLLEHQGQVVAVTHLHVPEAEASVLRPAGRGRRGGGGPGGTLSGRLALQVLEIRERGERRERERERTRENERERERERERGVDLCVSVEGCSSSSPILCRLTPLSCKPHRV